MLSNAVGHRKNEPAVSLALIRSGQRYINKYYIGYIVDIRSAMFLRNLKSFYSKSETLPTISLFYQKSSFKGEKRLREL